MTRSDMNKTELWQRSVALVELSPHCMDTSSGRPAAASISWTRTDGWWTAVDMALVRRVTDHTRVTHSATMLENSSMKTCVHPNLLQSVTGYLECSALKFYIYIYMRERGWVSLLDFDSEVFTKNSCRHSYWHIYDCVSDSVLICFRTLRKVLHN